MLSRAPAIHASCPGHDSAGTATRQTQGFTVVRKIAGPLTGDATRGIVLCDPKHISWDPSAPTPSPFKQAFRLEPSLGRLEPFGCHGITSAGACNRSTTVECRFKTSRQATHQAIRSLRPQPRRDRKPRKNPPDVAAVAVAADLKQVDQRPQKSHQQDDRPSGRSN